MVLLDLDKYQLVIVGVSDVGQAVGKQQHLPIGMYGEERKEVFLSGSYEISHRLSFWLGHRLAATVENAAAVERYSNSCQCENRKQSVKGHCVVMSVFPDGEVETYFPSERQSCG